MVGYLDTSVVLMDLLSREAQPEAIKRALAAVERRLKTKRRLPLESRSSAVFQDQRTRSFVLDVKSSSETNRPSKLQAIK